jgi:hypothetical protein
MTTPEKLSLAAGAYFAMSVFLSSLVGRYLCGPIDVSELTRDQTSEALSNGGDFASSAPAGVR